MPEGILPVLSINYLKILTRYILLRQKSYEPRHCLRRHIQPQCGRHLLVRLFQARFRSDGFHSSSIPFHLCRCHIQGSHTLRFHRQRRRVALPHTPRCPLLREKAVRVYFPVRQSIVRRCQKSGPGVRSYHHSIYGSNGHTLRPIVKCITNLHLEIIKKMLGFTYLAI